MEDLTLYTLLAIISLAILVLCFNRRSKTPNILKNGRLYNLPPGSMGWPLIGESIDYFLSLASTFRRQKFIADRQRRYGDIFSSNLFGRRIIVSVNPEVNKFVMQNEGRLFDAYYPKAFSNLIGKYALLALKGDLQRKTHAVAANLLSNEKLRTHFIDDILVLLTNGMSNWHGKEIKLEDECHQFSLDLMAKQLLDLSPSKETEDIRKQFSNFSRAILSLPIKIPGSTFTKGMKARKYLIKKIYETIEERRKEPQVVHNDLLAKLLSEDPVLSDEFVVDTLLFLLFAGHETTSQTMSKSIKYLKECPQAFKQLLDEHESLLKTKSQGPYKITWDDYKSMKFTQCVINEVLRIGNIASTLYREAKQDVNLKGFQIPQGSTILLHMSGVHKDEKNYSKALEFNPWRWEESKQDEKNNLLFTPFGGGGRFCPGYNLARLEVSLFLHLYVTQYRYQ